MTAALTSLVSIARNVSTVHTFDKGARKKIANMARDDKLADIRHYRLTLLLSGRFAESKTDMAAALGRSNSQIGHWFSRIRNPPATSPLHAGFLTSAVAPTPRDCGDL